MSTGDCFEAAGRYVADMMLTGRDDLFLVHGLPVGQAGVTQGKRYWHAWVEAGDDVIDCSNDRVLIAGREHYYRLGHLDEDHVYRYAPEKAGEQMLTYGHFGPWVEGWEHMEEVG